MGGSIIGAIFLILGGMIIIYIFFMDNRQVSAGVSSIL